MKLFLIVVVVFTTSLFAGSSYKIDDLSWLEGHWKGAVGKHSFETIYSGSDGGRILSISKELRPDGSLVFSEFEEFCKKDGKIQMSPWVNGKKLSVFALIEVSGKGRAAVFVNPANDFPSKIIYRLKDRDNLIITLTGAEKGKEIKVIYDLKRVK